MKRFWKEAGVAEVGGDWQVTLDGRGVKTQGGRQQIVPNRALAEALAAEWAAQGAEIDAAGFVLRDMADYAIDVVQPDPPAAIAALMAYGESDTLCYRAEPGEPLHRRQIAEWEPLLEAAEARRGVEFERISGIIHRPQSAATLAALRAELDGLDPFTCAALRTLSGLAASLVIALLAIEPGHGDDPLWLSNLWNAANLEEDFQIELWGTDAEAEALRARRKADFLSAARFAGLVRA